MAISNSDTPAAPTKGQLNREEKEVYDYQVGNGDEFQFTGFTKREKLAAMANVQSTFENYFTSYREMEVFIERKFDFSNRTECLKAESEVKAKLRLMDADSLIKELKK